MINKSVISGLFLISLSGLTAQNQPNVLFIAVDDLRPELGCYGKSQIKSPNIDKLAESGILFTRSFCNIPVCGASRASLLSGLRPNQHRFLNFSCFQDKDVPGVVSLPMHFRNNGYTTVSLGKVYHHETDGMGSWDRVWRPSPSTPTDWLDYQTELNIKTYKSPAARGCPYEKADVPDNAYFDGRIADRAMDELRQFKKEGKPFFLAVGFLKPHLPFNAPKKYWDLYPGEQIRLAPNPFRPEGAPDAAMHNFGELRAYYSIPEKGPVADSTALKLVHGYYACVSYTDAQIGKLLDELDRLGLSKNTIVILWGDHGWHLGEHGLWCKHCNFEKVLHTPLILKAPGMKAGLKSSGMVEYVDIYPSLCELAGLPLPYHLQGRSFVPLIKDPDKPWKEEVYCRWIRGETIITKTHAYTEWFDDKSGRSFARMLYDHTSDPEENVNISEKPDNQNLITVLKEKLLQHIGERDKLIIP